MTLNEFQLAALRTWKRRTWDADLTLAALGIGGESGEILEPIKKSIRDGTLLDFDHVALEIGDLLYYCAVLANLLGLPLSEVAQRNVDKLTVRHPPTANGDRAEAAGS